ncbi:MAG: hypothetical protein ACRYG7_11190 [Janthinobacterium lividum]
MTRGLPGLVEYVTIPAHLLLLVVRYVPLPTFATYHQQYPHPKAQGGQPATRPAE